MKTCPICRGRIAMRKLLTADLMKGVVCAGCGSDVRFSKWTLLLFPAAYMLVRPVLEMLPVRYTDGALRYLLLVAVLMGGIYFSGLAIAPLRAKRKSISS